MAQMYVKIPDHLLKDVGQVSQIKREKKKMNSIFFPQISLCLLSNDRKCNQVIGKAINQHIIDF